MKRDASAYLNVADDTARGVALRAISHSISIAVIAALGSAALTAVALFALVANHSVASSVTREALLATTTMAAGALIVSASYDHSTH